MRFTFDHDYHIHSYLSLCSSDEGQTNERILQYAKENRLHTVCLTNHYWDSAVENEYHRFYTPQNFENLKKALPLPQDEKVRFLFGCEGEMRLDGVLGIPESRFEEFAWILLPMTHLNWHGFTISHEDVLTPEGRAKTWVERLETVLNKDLPFHKIGLAHLASGGIFRESREGYLATLRSIPEAEMGRLFEMVAKVGCGVEINSYDMRFADEEKADVLRMFFIAKECGCKFYLGSDVHHPEAFADVPYLFDRAIRALELKEEDKFVLSVD